MKTYAQIDENNVAVAVSHLHSAVSAPNMVEVAADSDVLGKRYVSGAWESIPVDPISLVPRAVTRFQARAALAQAGLLGGVEAYMSGLPTTDIARLAWQDASEFVRASPTIAGMQQVLGLTDADVDALFIAASVITA
ncbi:hypothetical protein J5J83_19720 [Azoarcus sp. L1K30]|uniref:hypothetical protein n=1 Tax=Azoarcus sp. L1K30 TaxID=2820277 RepID=UPI001B838D29|nr:hypothetical protein [Azoarcus sp. L1K30]MBR0568356.1 hypothetical protein [Azoarcus sp. L1K30]